MNTEKSEAEGLILRALLEDTPGVWRPDARLCSHLRRPVGPAVALPSEQASHQELPKGGWRVHRESKLSFVARLSPRSLWV